MQPAEFEAELKSKRFTEIESRTIDPRPVNHGHTHDYDIRAMVLRRRHCEPGREARDLSRRRDFDVPAGRSHTEEIGAEGARIVVGRKY